MVHDMLITDHTMVYDMLITVHSVLLGPLGMLVTVHALAACLSDLPSKHSQGMSSACTSGKDHFTDITYHTILRAKMAGC